MTRSPNERRARKPPTGWLLAITVALGVLAGLGGYTFRYARGLSYLSTDPKACVNCHIMQRQYDGWQHASHHTAAVCIDCHLPVSFVRKYYVKAENGWRHGKKFTTQEFEEPIAIQAAGRAILQENCVRCHGALVASMQSAVHPDTFEGVECVHCHASVGHGQRAGLGGPLRADELTNTEPTAPARAGDSH